MSYRDFYNDLNKGVTRNVLFLYGDENFLMKWAIDEIIAANVEPENRAYDVMELQGEECNYDDIASVAMTYSMFGGKRVVLVRNYRPLFRKADAAAKVAEEKLLEFVKNPPDTAVVVFYLDSVHKGEMTALAKKLAAMRMTGYEFARLDRKELRSFIKKRTTAARKMISDRTLDHMIDLSGYCNREGSYSLAEIENDVSKLINAADGDTIDSKLVEDMMVGEGEKFVFSLIDALMANDKRKAMELTVNILGSADGNAMMLLALLTKQFELMYDSLELERRGMSVRQMAAATGTKEFRLKKAYSAALRFRPGRIKELLTELYNIDRSIRNGNIDKDLALELFVLY